ncbi:hypothetical protein [Fimbriiglobus ruber]|uniref:RNA-binding protein n=1 Tax=Fimbriiglobus ruber TaxID=1908690 RepID=A0A225E1C2_9BACT|nr:hypothetical protein [Fimbriiglobus ruber]OWK47520.1 RNA-binding protein [Fimbriiglobus ruber]
MKRLIPFAAAVIVAAVYSAPALAQPQVPGGGAGASSPFPGYLNLFRGNNPAFNYFGIVQPQMQLQQQYGQLQQQVQSNNQNIQQLGNAVTGQGDPRLALTGHPAIFNNTLGYFNSNPAFGGGSGGMGFARTPFGSNFGGGGLNAGGGIPRAPSGGGGGGGFGGGGFSGGGFGGGYGGR